MFIDSLTMARLLAAGSPSRRILEALSVNRPGPRQIISAVSETVEVSCYTIDDLEAQLANEIVDRRSVTNALQNLVHAGLAATALRRRNWWERILGVRSRREFWITTAGLLNLKPLQQVEGAAA
jgi:hypothetical protein